MTSILVVSESYWGWSSPGGGELATHLILKLLKDEGFRITVLTGSTEPEKIEGIEYVYCPLLVPWPKVRMWLSLLTCNDWVEKLVKRSDLVYVPGFAYPVIPLANKHSKKAVVHMHNYQPVNFQGVVLYPYGNITNDLLSSMKYSFTLEILEYSDWKRAVASSVMSPINALCRLWLSQADELICVSERQAEIIAKEAPKLADRIKVIYNPLPRIPVVKKTPSDPPSMLYLGGDLYTKGFHILLKASSVFLRQNVNVKFLLTKELGKMGRQMIERLNKKFNGAYVLLGRLKHEEVLRLHSLSHALIFPSVWEEPWGYAITEAMLSGTIPVTSKVGGVPEIIRGTSAERMMFTPGDPNELAEKMEDVLSLPREQLVDIGAKLRESVAKRFSDEEVRRKLRDTFES